MGVAALIVGVFAACGGGTNAPDPSSPPAPRSTVLDDLTLVLDESAEPILSGLRARLDPVHGDRLPALPIESRLTVYSEDGQMPDVANLAAADPVVVGAINARYATADEAAAALEAVREVASRELSVYASAVEVKGIGEGGWIIAVSDTLENRVLTVVAATTDVSVVAVVGRGPISEEQLVEVLGSLR